ncbi:hypothetical protein K438DRAFT_1800054 [Mycena galopus ATCC 62051]|nr:hypothetical protein K438DRAFT_1800054 [Mycena galopus ATCC 62051]
MAPLPSRKELEALRRPDLQALCKDYGVKANLKSEALIELLLNTKKPNSRGAAAPVTRRSVSTRQPSSRSAPGPRISSTKPGPPMGRSCASTVTPEPPAAETSTPDGSAALASAVADAMQPVYQQMQSLRSELEQERSQLKKQVADMQELEQKVVALTAQVDTLTAQSVTTTALDAQLKQVKDMVATNSSRSVPNPSTPRFPSPAPRPSVDENANASSSNSKTISPIKNPELPNPGIAPSMLGKRSRDSTSSNLTGIIDEGQEGDLSEGELAKRVVRPTKKRPKLQEEPEEDFEIETESDAPRVPSFTVFTGEEVDTYIDPPPPTEGLPDFYASTSPSGSGSRQGTTTSTQNASENQHPFTFAFLPISSTPTGASAFELPSFPYPEAPQSPTPAGSSHSGPSRNHGERTDIFGSFGLPPPGRPRSRVTSTSAGSAVSRENGNTGAFVDPAALTHRASDQEGRDDSDSGFGGFTRDGDGEQALKRTMYGTELDANSSRFGDFGLEGVASGFNWGGGRF